MGELKFKLQNEKILNGLLILLPASLPFQLRVSSTIYALISIFWLLKNYDSLIKLLTSVSVLIFIGVFLLSLISVLYSENITLKPIETKLPLLIFPLLMSSVKLDKKVADLMLFSFVIGCTLASAYSTIYAIYDPSLFGSEMTLETIGISHVYFGMYLCFAVAVLFYFLITRKYSNYKYFLILLWVAFLLTILFILASRMAIISILILFTIASIYYIKKKGNWIKIVSLIVFMSSIFLFAMSSFENSKNRLLFLFDKQNYYVGDNYWNNIGSRLSSLSCIFDVVKKAPILGTGIGDVQNDLDRCNTKKGYRTLVSMNAHNQFLQVLLSTGFAGLSSFVFLLSYTAVYAYRSKSKLYLSFIFIFSLCCLTESLLERQQGVLFYALFNSLFFFHLSNRT